MTGTLRERAVEAALDKAWGNGPWDMTKLEATGIADAVLAVVADTWREEGRGVLSNHARQDLTPQNRVLHWLRS